MEGKAVELTWFGNDVGTRMPCEVVAVALPIAVETEFPDPCDREADDIAILRLVEKVGDNNNVVRRSPFVPAVEGNNLVFFVQVIDLGELPAEAARETGIVEPQADEVAVQPNDAVELIAFGPNRRGPCRGTILLRGIPAPERASVCQAR